MKEFVAKNRIVISAAIAVIYALISLIYDKSTFTFPNSGDKYFALAVTDYVICKIVMLVVLFAFFYCLALAATDETEKGTRIRGIIKTALPYVVVIVAVLAIKLPAGFLSNDENSIYANAVTLTHDTWFNYLTNYYYIVALMIFPFKYGPIILKVIIQLLCASYVVYRIREYFGMKIGMLSYILFLLYPVIAYTTSAHRLPIYFLIYLTIFVKLLFDGLNKAKLSALEEVILIIAGAILTQWRTEGIYLAVLVPILCLFAYENLRNKKQIIILVLSCIVAQYIISIPQTGFTANNLDGAANDRMKPFYAYTITNMYRNGLDLQKNADDLAIVDKYLSLEVIEAINEHYVDINYEDVLILYQDGFIGVRQEASVEDFINYSDALKRIFVNNPDVFIKTRWGAFCYAALPYHITYNGMGIKSLISFGISIVKSILYNLFIPVGIAFVLCIYSLFKRRWYSFFVFGGLIAHWFIVFILAPASYFKYYFPVYIMSYFYVIVIALWLYLTRKGQKLLSPLR